jgi:DNA-binding GntR family transcriptional regulator
MEETTQPGPTSSAQNRVRRANLADGVYEQLRWDIVHGVLRPNEALIEQELGERLSVSRTPIRESLLRLSADGLVVLRNRRWQVYEHTPQEVREIYEIRACQEGFAARLACERATEEQVAAIEAARDIATQPTEPTERVMDNDMFHDLVNQASGNTRLFQLIHRSRLYHFNRRVAALYTDDELAESSRQHLEIIAAVVARDGDSAERIVRNHVMDALELTLKYLY